MEEIEKRIVLVINLEVSEGRSDKIEVSEEDEPDSLAQAFCLKHNLSNKIQLLLQKYIENKIDELIEQILCPRKEFFEDISESTNQIHYNISSELLAEPKELKTQKISRFEHLYQKALQLRLKQQKKTQAAIEKKKLEDIKETTFTPKINKNTLIRKQPAQEIFFQKLAAQKEILIKKKKQKEEEEMIECTFTPKIINGHQRNSSVNIFDRLYTYEKTSHFKCKYEKYSKPYYTTGFQSPSTSKSKPNYTLPTYPELTPSKKKIEYKSLFKKLSNNSELITPETLENSLLPERYLKRLEPFFSSTKLPLNYSEFSSDLSLFLSSKPFDFEISILTPPKQHPKYEPPSIYTRGLTHIENRKRFRKQSLDKKTEEELAECTFKPRIK